MNKRVFPVGNGRNGRNHAPEFETVEPGRTLPAFDISLICFFFLFVVADPIRWNGSEMEMKFNGMLYDGNKQQQQKSNEPIGSLDGMSEMIDFSLYRRLRKDSDSSKMTRVGDVHHSFE